MSALAVLSLVGRSGSGKTTALLQLLPCLQARGYRVACCKRSHHPLTAEPADKDSARLAAAGARWTGLAASGGLSLRGDFDPMDVLTALAERSGLDLLLCEGGKSGPFAKIEVHREHPPMLPASELLARIGPPVGDAAACLSPDDPEGWCEFLLRRGVLRPAR